MSKWIYSCPNYKDLFTFDSLPELLVKAYSIRSNFSIRKDDSSVSLSFVFPDEMNCSINDDVSKEMTDLFYISHFYTFVSMVLTRDERDEFIRLFRGDK